MTTGDHVTVEIEGQSRPATILLASGNERSLMLSFDGVIAGHVGMMPVLRDDDGVYRSLLGGIAVKVTP